MLAAGLIQPVGVHHVLVLLRNVCSLSFRWAALQFLPRCGTLLQGPSSIFISTCDQQTIVDQWREQKAQLSCTQPAIALGYVPVVSIMHAPSVLATLCITFVLFAAAGDGAQRECSWAEAHRPPHSSDAAAEQVRRSSAIASQTPPSPFRGHACQ